MADFLEMLKEISQNGGGTMLNRSQKELVCGKAVPAWGNLS